MTEQSPDGLVVLVVDDEPPARRRLADLLEQVREVARVLEAADGWSAVETIRAGSPDLVFLDVQMPGLDGMGVLREIGVDRMPPTVLVTAHDRHAVGAFEAGAVDYLLKPFGDARFEAALIRARQRLADGELRRIGRDALRRLANADKDAGTRAERLLVRSGSATRVIPLREIDAVAGAGVYVTLHVAGRELLHRASLSELERTLGPRFVRVHRSTLVNLDALVQLTPLSHGDFELTLRHGERLRASRTYRAELERRLGQAL